MATRTTTTILAGLAAAGLLAGCDTGDGAVALDEVRPVPAPSGKADAQTAGLPMISEYVEATFSNNKAVELFNPLPFAVAMDACSVRVHHNGAAQPTRTIRLTGHVMQPHGTLVLCHTGAAAIADACDVATAALSFNGNDAIDLACDFGSGPQRLDVLGVVGNDPGRKGWAVDGALHGTTDATLRRRCSVRAGDDAFTSSQWEVAGENAFDDLGSHELCDDGPQPEPEPVACNQGPDVVGADADAIFAGTDPRFSIDLQEVLFDDAAFTAIAQDLLLRAASRFLLDGDALTDAASALAGVAREGSGRVEVFRIRDTATDITYDAVRYYANDATDHSVVARADTGATVAFAFDGELFLCDPVFCEDGELSRRVFDGLDEDFEPIDQYEVLMHETVLREFPRRSRVLRSDAGAGLLSVAWNEHAGDALDTSHALEQIARDNSGPITYVFMGGPTEDLEGVVFHLGGVDHGLLVVEDSLDPELITHDGVVQSCAPPFGG